MGGWFGGVEEVPMMKMIPTPLAMMNGRPAVLRMPECLQSGRISMK